MCPAERYRWILGFMQRGHGRSVDILYSDFVCDYIDATGVNGVVQFFGAPKCPQFGRDLAAMFRAGILDRYATGLPTGDSAMGFPKWVYTYRIRDV
jgi:hypothetical protein